MILIKGLTDRLMSEKRTNKLFVELGLELENSAEKAGPLPLPGDHPDLERLVKEACEELVKSGKLAGDFVSKHISNLIDFYKHVAETIRKLRTTPLIHQQLLPRSMTYFLVKRMFL